MSKSVFVTREIPAIAIERLRSRGYTVDVGGWKVPPTQREIIRALKKKPYDAVLTLLTDKIDATVFDAVPHTKLYANYAIGYDNVDIKEAQKRGIFVTNTPGSYSDSIAEHTIALVLSLTARITESDRFVRAGKYKGWSPMNFIGTDLAGKTIGIVGTGRIGASVAHHFAKGFDSKIIYYDVVRNEKIEKDCGATFVPSVEEVLRLADIVTIHVPLLESTHHLINEARLHMMKPTAYLVNTSRGPVIDEVALVNALKSNVIRGAGLDVFEFEPKLARGLTKLSNVVLTPHIASAREHARDEMARVVADNIIDFIEGKIPRNNVYS
ncbi:MAG: D-glycerate dehydrogenase [Candidatus Taylorbacteria bacterium CG10_big_fil_rev_8_21_14_0_10_41_48]|uniref:D-glycerate dehydrogenase n=1 Tax=Candidatus Taylorbacteria bacterium CG10_big_fil_rev_8_21_14_0_10_41_48 TaxID=1975024 RepID=A0A2M8LCS7_9BACT|nr:MAG: D-glycerate dehydrogenase [Candidatus Taylorbacteria bacterium CG10_big_fil_rev_8_21_14_0_10_41_48]